MVSQRTVSWAAFACSDVNWPRAVRIIRSLHPPIDLFEDLADPADWALLISAEQKTNPRLMESLGNLDLVPEARRVGGPGATYLMSPFTHISRDRPSRFSDGTFGVLYAANHFKVALLETIYHHGLFMARTREAAGWSCGFREIRLKIHANLHDLRGDAGASHAALHRNNYAAGHQLGRSLQAAGADGVVYPSQRSAGGDCVGLFYPNLARKPVQGRHLDYHWNGEAVDLYRDQSTRKVYRLTLN
jgi:RES domain